MLDSRCEHKDANSCSKHTLAFMKVLRILGLREATAASAISPF